MNSSEKTRELLIQHYQTYPKLQIQDIFKYLYQSSFGCEHLVSSIETVTEYIRKEYDSIRHDNHASIEPLDGRYSRVPLSCLDRGISADTLGRLFCLSAGKEETGLTDLLEKLRIAHELVLENVLPFSPADFETSVKDWAKKGYPAVHHSDIFRENYKPSYRVIANEYLHLLTTSD